jgi:predicted chitinase
MRALWMQFQNMVAIWFWNQNGDGKVDMSDAMDAVTKKVVGIGGMLSGLFGK